MPKLQGLRRFWREEGGASTVEMGILISLIAVTALGAMEILGGTISGLFSDTGGKLNTASPAAGG